MWAADQDAGSSIFSSLKNQGRRYGVAPTVSPNDLAANAAGSTILALSVAVHRLGQ